MFPYKSAVFVVRTTKRCFLQIEVCLILDLGQSRVLRRVPLLSVGPAGYPAAPTELPVLTALNGPQRPSLSHLSPSLPYWQPYWQRAS